MNSDRPAVKARRGAGRPAQTTEEFDARRRVLVSAAYEVFAEKGYHDSGIADIASRVGAGHGTFYRYFQNKREILDHVIDYAIERAMDSISFEDFESAANPAELRQQLIQLSNRLFTQLIDVEPHLPRMLLLESAAVDEALLQRGLGLMEMAIVTIADALRGAQARGLLREELNCNSAARALFGCATAAFLAEARTPGLDQNARDLFIDTVVGFVCG